MFSKIFLAAGLAAISNLAVASPIQENSVQDSLIQERGAIEPQDSPSYCQILGNERASVDYIYYDLSKECQDAGLSDKCCMTFDVHGPTKTWSEQDRTDLMSVIAQQSKKDSTFDQSSAGNWRAGYEILTSNDMVDSQVLQVWFHSIQNVNLDQTSGLGNVYLQIVQGTGDITNYMWIHRS